VVTKSPAQTNARKVGALDLTDEQLLDMYYKMLLARALNQRWWMLNRLGKAPFAITGDGHEACQVGTAYALRPGRDWVVPYYRDMGVALVLGMTAREMMLGVFAKPDDPASGGRQMSGHYSHSRLRMVSLSSPVGVQIPRAAGIAFASKLRGEDDVTITYFGEGATSKGDFHEGLNFAGVHKVPCIFVCENNQYAISEHQSKQMAIENVSMRAASYGFPGVTVDGNDVLACYRAAVEAVRRARAGEGPTLIECKTYRLVPHSSDDDDRRYRRREEVEQWKSRDPILRFKAYLEEHELLNAKKNEALHKRVAKEVDEATEFAEKAPYAKPEDALTKVFVEEPTASAKRRR